MAGKGMKPTAVLSVLVMLILPLFSFSGEAQERSEVLSGDAIPHKIFWGYLDDTDVLQGGKVLKLILGEESYLTFIWGTRENRGPITVITGGVDVLGHVDHGSKKVPIKSEAITVYTLQGLVEFEDADDNGHYDPRSTLSADTAGDTIVKAASLSLAWTFHQRPPVNTREGLEWTFSLEARNITYTRTASDAGSLTASSVDARIFLELVRFVFHIRVTPMGEVRLLTDYRTDNITSSSTTVDSRETRYPMEGMASSVKIDHLIRGWDYARDNERPMLMLKFHLGIGRTFDVSLVKDLYDRSKIRYYGSTSLAYSTGSRESQFWTEDSKEVKWAPSNATGEGGISLLLGERSLAGFIWTGRGIPNSVDRMDTAVPTAAFGDPKLIGPFNGLWSYRLIASRIGLGVSLSGAFYYGGGEDIYHDPEVRTVGWKVKPKDENSGGDSILPGWFKERPGVSALLVISVVTVLVAVSIIAALTRRRYDMEDEELR
ncbi:MAG: hypothetical protein ACMUHB_02120, partial [Thermoplasmatota archaeon]